MAVRPGPQDLAFLMHRRNSIAAALNRNHHGRDATAGSAGGGADGGGGGGGASGGEGAMGGGRGGDVSFAGGTLPPIEQCSSECERCFVKEACMTVNAALEGGAAGLSDPGVAGRGLHSSTMQLNLSRY